MFPNGEKWKIEPKAVSYSPSLQVFEKWHEV